VVFWVMTSVGVNVPVEHATSRFKFKTETVCSSEMLVTTSHTTYTTSNPYGHNTNNTASVHYSRNHQFKFRVKFISLKR
jgi:hypothetical protein